MFYFFFLLRVRCSKFIHQIVNCFSAGNFFITKFTSKFSSVFSSRSYTAPWRHKPLTNCKWEQMATGADNGAVNCSILLTNHKQIVTHEPHCYPWNIMTSSGLQFNYFRLFQTLSADSSAKFICSCRQAEHRSPWSAEPWTQVTKKLPCTT
jgi:hypothetical protein